MKIQQAIMDKAAIGFSVVCAIHCLLVPLMVVLLPAIAATPLGDEAFHQMMLFAIIPSSFIALFLGCRKHRNMSIAALVFGGVAVLVVAALFGHDYLGETMEKVMTVIGASLVAFGHFKNHRLCQQHQCHH